MLRKYYRKLKCPTIMCFLLRIFYLAILFGIIVLNCNNMTMLIRLKFCAFLILDNVKKATFMLI